MDMLSIYKLNAMIVYIISVISDAEALQADLDKGIQQQIRYKMPRLIQTKLLYTVSDFDTI